MTDTASKGRGLRIALFASLALNLAVVGAVAGFVMVGPPGAHGRPGGGDPALPYTRALTEAQRRDLRDQLRGEGQGDRREMREIRRNVIADYQTALQLLRSQPFDPAALERLMTAQAERSARVRARGQAVLSAYLAAMPPEARAAYADRLEDTLSRLQRRRGHEHHDTGEAPGGPTE